MKIFTRFLFAVLVALTSSISASAYDFVEGGIYYNILSLPELTCEVTYKDYNFNSYSGKVAIPASVTIGGKTFTVTSIGINAFFKSSNLTSVEIPNTVTSIGGSAFEGCTNLISVEIPNSVTSIGRHAFDGCTSLASVEIGSSVTSIGECAFQSCSSLTSVVIPNSVTSIEGYAFNNSKSLKSVVIGNSVTTIGEHAFGYNTKLKEVTSLNVTPPNAASDAFEGINTNECVLKVPEESIFSYRTANVWKEFWNVEGLSEGGGGEQPGTNKCEAPEIALFSGKIVAASSTPGATCCTTITTEDVKTVDGNLMIELSGVYKIIAVR